MKTILRLSAGLTALLFVFMVWNFKVLFQPLKIAEELSRGDFLVSQAMAQQPKGEPQAASAVVKNDVTGGTRIVISTSGPAEFSSHWLDNPPRLLIEFQSRNILSEMDDEVVINQGAVKKITSSYFGRGRRRSLKSLTFELTQDAAYRVWQEDNTILLDIQAPEPSTFFQEGGKTFATGKAMGVMVKRIEAMDIALTQAAGTQPSLKGPQVETEIVKSAEAEVAGAREAAVKVREAAVGAKGEAAVEDRPIPLAHSSPKARKSIIGVVLWLLGLISVSGLGIFGWWRYTQNVDRRLKQFKSELNERDGLLTQEKALRNTMEGTLLQREKEYMQFKRSAEKLKTALQEKNKLPAEQENISETKPPSCEEKEISPPAKKSQERRAYPRLSLSRDFDKTVILRIESQNLPQNMRCFAENISSGGLCFETKQGDFKENEPLNLRLFFYGDRLPMIKVQARIIWKNTIGQVSYYGISFDSIEEKDKSELDNYVESKMNEGTAEV